MSRRVFAVPGTVVPSAACTTCTGSGAPPASRSPNGTPSAVASDERVSIVGLPRPASSAESVAFAIPLARASSDRLRPCSPRRRRRLAATTGMRSFTMSNERTNESNGNTASGTRRGPGHRSLRRGRRRLRGHLRRPGPRRGPRRPEGRRLLGHHLRRLGAVRRHLGALGRRHARGRHRRRRPAQHPLHPDRPVGGAVAARPRVEARPARAARRRRVLGGQPPGRGALRPAPAPRRRPDALLRVGGRDDGRQRGRIAARRPRDARARRRLPGALPRPPRRPGPRPHRAWPRRSAGRWWRRRSCPSCRPGCRSWPRRSCASSACGARRARRRRDARLGPHRGRRRLHDRAEGPRPAGHRRPLAARGPLLGVVALLAPTLLAALIVTQAFADGRHLVVDARAAGLVVALVAVLLRAPVLVVVVLAAATAALARVVA